MPSQPKRTYEVVDAACRDALDVRLLHDGEEGPLGAPPGLEQGGEVAALAQLRDLQLDAAGARVPAPRPVAIAPGGAIRAALAVAGADLRGDLGLHHRLGEHRDRLTQEVEVTPGCLLAEQLQQVHAFPDHRSPPSCSSDLHEDGAVVFYVHSSPTPRPGTLLSAIDCPSPSSRSTSRSFRTICSGVCLRRFTVMSSFTHLRGPKDSHQQRSGFKGSGHGRCWLARPGARPGVQGT